MKNLLLVLIFIIAVACNKTKTQQPTASQAAKLTSATFTASAKLDDYWYQGKAEVNRYELQQNRYRDVHPGEAILVFVTEDFLTDKQVKNDNYKNPNSINVLKTNQIRRFATGIYDYSIMTSVFTPINAEKNSHTLKVTNSTQDWCGQAFMQVNWLDNQYQTQIRSYFENEADQNFAVPAAILEDELFNRIRLNPQGLPTGKIQILPSLSITRLLHQPFKAEAAEASLQAYKGNEFQGNNLQSYLVTFSTNQRTLEIIFENESPYVIVGWKETYPSFDGKARTTIAKRTNTILTAYWQQNSLEDKDLRKKLGIEGL
ncbi:MAG: hypothetical protein ACK4TA_03415 [Saprospiraceae bacterium]